MHILFITDNFPPEVNAPASRTYEHAVEWVKLGHHVTVITCVPNFPRGEIFDGYENKFRQMEKMDGITILRVWSFIAPNVGFVIRILDYISFMFSALLQSFRIKSFDLVVGTSPQFFSAMGAWLISRFRRKAFVFELRDIWPESIRAVGAIQDGILFRLLENLELFLYGEAAHVVTVTESFRKNLVHRQIIPRKISVVINGIDRSRYFPRPKDQDLLQKYGLKDKFVAGYIGTQGMAHALDTLMEAARVIAHADTDDRFRLIFIGDGAQHAHLKMLINNSQIKNVVMLDMLPKTEIAAHWALLDVCIIHLKRTDLFKTVIPSKLFESIGMGIPILHGVEGESAEIVLQNQVGMLFEPENAEQLVEKLMHLMNNPSICQEYTANCMLAAGRYDRKNLAQNMLNHFESTLTSNT